MIAFNTPVRRIALAIGLSALVHALVLWLPNLRLPRAKVQLPPLTARIEHVTQPVETSSTQPHPDSPLAVGEQGTLAASAPKAAVTMKKMQASTNQQLFPKHLKLTFIAYQGEPARGVGKVLHHLEVESDHYTLRAETQATSPVSSLHARYAVQTSTGKFDRQGLQPEFFKEETFTGNRIQNRETHFDWANQMLYLANGEQANLPANAQDMLSFLYQISHIRFEGEFFMLPISDGDQLTPYQIEIGAMENLDTPMGKLRARHLRQMHEQRTAYFEIWIAPEYRMLPVRFRWANEADETVEEFIIADIQVADP